MSEPLPPAAAPDAATGARRLAVLDLGSNSVRLLVVQAGADGFYRVLDDERLPTRLATGVEATGRLDPEAARRTLVGLRLMRRIARNHGAPIAVAVATSAVRESADREAFLQRASRALGTPVRVITGAEEARFAFESARRHFAIGPGRTAVLDYGGGSVDVVIAAGGAIEAAHSLPLGAVRLTEAFLHHDPPRRHEIDALRRHLRRLTATLPRGVTVDRAIGSGGTVTALATVAQAREGERLASPHGYAMNRGQLRHLAEWLARRSAAERADLPGVSPDRADLLVAGAVALDEILGRLHARTLVTNAHGLREGIVLALLRDGPGGRRRRAPADVRRAGLLRFADRCGWERRHAEHVAHLALRIHDQVAARAGLPPEARGWLEAAALLHDVGYCVNYSGHHRHAYSLILHADLPGLTPREVRLVALVARYHTGARPKKKHGEYAALGKDERRLVRLLAAILRIADGADRAHGRDVRDVLVRRRGDVTTFTLVAGRDGPLGLEGAQAKSRLFERAFGTVVRFALARAPRRAGASRELHAPSH